MFFDEKIVATSVMALQFNFEKKKAVFVPGRSYHALTFRTEGKISIEYDEKRLVSCAGTITYIPKGFSYNTEIIENGNVFAIHFDVADEYENLLPDVLTPTCPVTFCNMFSEIVSRYKLGRENDLCCMSMLYGILAEVKAEHDKTRKNIVHPKIKRVKDRIERGFYDSELSVSALAEEMGMSAVYLRKKFGTAYGISPGAYIKKVRIENAKAFLRTGLFSVTEVAGKCGFNSISYFSYEFHDKEGITPKEYAEKFR